MIAADTAIHQSKIKISSIGKEVIQEVMKRQIRQTSSDLKKRENWYKLQNYFYLTLNARQ